MKNPQGRALHISLLFLHLGLQLAVAYWSVLLDYYYCQEQQIRNISYFAYSLIIMNLFLIAFINSREGYCNSWWMVAVVEVANLGLLSGVIYMQVVGVLNGGGCAAAKVLYQFGFIEGVVAVVLSVCGLAGKWGWVDRYLHWPGNVVFPIMFLKWGFPGPLFTSAIVIGAITTAICLTSFLLHCLAYPSLQLQSSHSTLYKYHWYVSIFLLIGCLILALVMLCINDKDGDYYWTYGRKTFVVFLGVSMLDIGFWVYGFRRVRFWSAVPM